MRQSWIDEVQAEIATCLNILYPIIDVFRSDDDFAEELMGMDPPLPIYLLSLLSSLSNRNRSVKSYPAKKLLLVTWKVLLACLGGMAEQARARSLARDLAGLPPLAETAAGLKSNPIDLQTFREETCVKYPTFTPPPLTITASTIARGNSTNGRSGSGSGISNSNNDGNSGNTNRNSYPSSGLRSIDDPVQRRTTTNHVPLGLPTAKLAQALSPLPVRPHYVHPDANANGGGGNGAGGPDDPTGTNSVLNAPGFGGNGAYTRTHSLPFPYRAPVFSCLVFAYEDNLVQR
ncbi:Factor arrest protein 11 [Serendipita sp. 400]|nr:Factor arrest protein 11 [Serendipita sp. 400]